MAELDERILIFTIESLINDYPEQFKDREHITEEDFKNSTNINKLSRAIDVQLKAIQDSIKDLHRFRTLEGGYNFYPPDIMDMHDKDKQLDLAGDNVVMSRADAGVISSPNQDVTNQPVMNNEEYSKYLKYKAYKNSSECTYYDLMEMLSILTNATDIGYREDPAHPATIFVKPNSWDIDFPPVAPAGVGFIVEREKKGSLEMFAGVGSVIKKTVHCTFDATTA